MNDKTICDIYLKWNIIPCKRKGILPHAATEMNVENIMLSEISW